MTQLPSLPDDFPELRRLAAHFGSDAMHVQGAGGNASVKTNEAMWIKASGTLMGTALKRDIFVATDLRAIHTALAEGDPAADQPASFSLGQGDGLRPSIETSLHAVFPQRIVLHTHCVHTLAHAVRLEAEALLAEKLRPFDWRFVPYAKPGANLARSVKAAMGPNTDVIVLGNHGLIVAGETAQDVADLQTRVHSALALQAAPFQTSDVDRLKALSEKSRFILPEDVSLHQLALVPGRVAQVTKGSLYPDHVIFCGIAVPALDAGETISEAIERIDQTGAPTPPWLLIPRAGVVVRDDIKEPALVMMRCLADVMARVPNDAALSYLSVEQNLELLNWDAEKYRQALNAG